MHTTNFWLGAVLSLSLAGCGDPPVSEEGPTPDGRLAPPERPRVEFRAPVEDVPARPAVVPSPVPDGRLAPPRPEVTEGTEGTKGSPTPDRRLAPPVAPKPEPTIILVQPSQEVSPVPATVGAAETPKPPIIALPKPPSFLTSEGRSLIYEFEVGGGAPYYNRFLARPSWPGAASGVTVGIGYDCGYNSKAVILSDWQELKDAPRLAAVSGIKGAAAKARIAEVRDILIGWGFAETVYNNVTVTKFWQVCQRTWPGFNDLHPNAQAALLSLTFNRGDSLIGERRKEMKEISHLSPKHDYRGMAGQFRAMKRVWRGTDIEAGMYRRRDAEAQLMESAS